MTYRHFFSATTILVALAAAGCTARTLEDDYRAAVPSREALTVEAPGVSMPDGEGDVGSASEALVGERADFYELTREASRNVNGTVWVALNILETIVEHPPSVVDESHAVWGPWNDSLSPVAYVLLVDKLAEDDYRYVLRAKPRDAGEDAWVDIVAGESKLDAAGDLREGSIGLDFDAAHGIDSYEHPTQGRFAASFELGGADYDLLEAAFEDVHGPDADGPVSGVYRYREYRSGAGTLEFATNGDLEDEGGAREDLVVNSRWDDAGAGRGDALVSGGDLGDAVVRASECWDTSFARIYWSDNAGMQPNEGDADACAYSEPLWSEM